MSIVVPYGKDKQIGEIPGRFRVLLGKLNPVAPQREAPDEIREALRNLIGEVDVTKIRQASIVAIAVNDITRPVPNKIVLPILLDQLNAWGIADNQIRLVVGGGLHRPVTPADLTVMLGDAVLKRVEVYSHNARNTQELVYLGRSTAGTPVHVNKYFYEADARIVTGMIDPHQFMGFTAGVKAAVIGLGGEETIGHNHAKLFNHGADLGQLAGNPARDDLEDIGQMIGIDLILNVILNEQKQVVKAVAGHPITAHRIGVGFARTVFGVELEKAEVVIASAGGFPKDINVYQAQKALTPAMQVVKPGGTIILVAECREGSGEELFEKEMSAYSSVEEIIASFRHKPFVIGAHKAYLWARPLAAARTIVVSDKIDKALGELLMVKVKPNLQAALDVVLPDYQDGATIVVLPYAPSLIPLLPDENSAQEGLAE